MRCPVLVLCLAIVSTLSTADSLPATFIPPQAEVAVQVPDLARSQSRWTHTPYPRLLQTGWGRMLVGEWSSRLEALAPGAGDALGELRSLAIAAQSGAEAMPHLTIAALGGAHLPGLLQALGQGHLPGALVTHGAVVAWSNGAAPQPGAAPPAPDAEADVGLRLVAGRWLQGVEGDLRIELQLDAAGLRETTIAAPTAATRLAAVVPRTWADPQELRRLPATTLWAATWQGDPALAAGLAGQDEQGMAAIERWLAETGLPGWRETLAAATGPSTVWMAEGLPFPSFGAALGLRDEVAKRWIAAATAQLNLAATPEGAAGYVGLLPFAIGLAGDGRLVLTTDPMGVTAWQTAKPGFADHRGVAEVLAKAPSRTLLLGAGRGGTSWAALAQLSLPLFTAMGAPQVVSLPGDLRLAADRGWLYVRLLEDGTVRCESGGLFGGPFTTAVAAGITVPTTMWLQRELQHEKKIPAPEPESPAPAPVF